MMFSRQSITSAVWAAVLFLLLFSGITHASDYFWTKEGARVWNPTPKPGMSATWSGEQDTEGYATGKGVLQYYVNNQEADRYEGSMSRGRFHGKGSISSFPRFYDGDFVDGLFHGNGVLAVIPQGPVYRGEFKAGLFDGKGFLQYPDGTKYEGDFSAGIPQGTGSKLFRNGDLYEGQFASGKPNGRGKISGKDGRFYEGNYVDGVPHGQGIWRVPLTKGEFVTYNGTFVNGQLTVGIGKFANGMEMEGEFVEGVLQGKGILRFPNGFYIQGEMFQGQPHGYATLYHADGTILKQGQWKNGDFVDG